MSNTAFLNNPDFPYSLSVLVRALFNLEISNKAYLFYPR